MGVGCVYARGGVLLPCAAAAPVTRQPAGAGFEARTHCLLHIVAREVLQILSSAARSCRTNRKQLLQVVSL